MINKRYLVFCLLVIQLLTLNPISADTPLRFYYFNPDSPLNNLEQLKNDMETLLDSQGVSIRFQPFSRLTDFHRQLLADKPAFVFAPNWYLKQHAKDMQLQPMLQSIRNSTQFYKKILITGAHFSNKTGPNQHISVAMTSRGPDSSMIFDSILPNPNELVTSKFNIVEVPKDPDAIFAAALGQVDMALVSRASLEQLQAINPRLVDSLKILLESKPLQMPVLSFAEGTVNADIQKHFSEFLISSRNSAVMQKLRIDDWSQIQ